MANADIIIADEKLLPQAVELYNQIFRPRREVDFFKRRFMGRYNTLTLIARIQGDAVAQAIQLAIEYDPAPPFPGGHPDRAPEGVTAGLKARVYDAAAARMEAALAR